MLSQQRLPKFTGCGILCALQPLTEALGTEPIREGIYVVEGKRMHLGQSCSLSCHRVPQCRRQRSSFFKIAKGLVQDEGGIEDNAKSADSGLP